MTATDRPVQRVTVKEFMVLFPNNRKKARRIVARIDSGDIIRFREAGRRQWYDLPIEDAFSIAVKCSAGFRVCHVPGPSLQKKGKRT